MTYTKREKYKQKRSKHLFPENKSLAKGDNSGLNLFFSFNKAKKKPLKKCNCNFM